MPTILYRNLGPNYDPLRGQGQQNFLPDLQAVTQAILTRLNLFLGEWWADLADGTPVFQDLLGVAPNVQQATTLLTQRILGTPYVTGIVSLDSSFDSSTLTFSFTATVQTQFGLTTVTNIPTPPSQALPS